MIAIYCVFSLETSAVAQPIVQAPAAASQIKNAAPSRPPITIDSQWKKELFEFSERESRHTSWGHSHGIRNYLVSRQLAEAMGFSLDEDVLFAAAFLHDLGGLEPYAEKGKDHHVRSAELAIDLLPKFGFPRSKIAAVQRMIIDHVYYGPRPRSTASQIFRDADILDFLGILGFSRVLGASAELDPQKKSLKTGLKVFKDLTDKLPKLLLTAPARKKARGLIKESQFLIFRLESETNGAADL